MKNKIISIVAFIIVVVISIGMIYSLTKPLNLPEIELKSEVYVFEFGSSYAYDKAYYIDADEAIMDKIKIVINGEDLDHRIMYDITLEAWLEIYAVGQYEGVVSYKNKEMKFIVEIKDTTNPELFMLVEKIEVERNAENIEYEQYFYVDDYSECKIVVDSSSVDVTKAGSYEMTVTAEDIYGNATTMLTEVTVK